MKKKQAGFVMPMTLVVLVWVAILATAAMHLAASDYRASRGARLAHRALYAAEAGSFRTLRAWRGSAFAGLAAGDSIWSAWLDLPDGSSYRSGVLRVDDGSGGLAGAIYRITTEGRPPGAGLARRSVTTVAAGQTAPTLCCSAALSVDGDVRIDGPVATGGGRGGGRGRGGGGGGSQASNDSLLMVDGKDYMPADWSSFCSTPSIPVSGIVLPETDDLMINGLAIVDGTPDYRRDATVDASLVSVLGDWTYDDLADEATLQISGNYVRYREEVGPSAVGSSCTVADTLNWGDPAAPGMACGNYFPIIHADGTLRIEGGGAGQGILLVDGDLEVEGDFAFHGLVVVRGRAVWEDTSRLYGGLVAGNRGISGVQSVVQDSALVRYSSCAVQRASEGLAGVEVLSGRQWFEGS